MYRSDWKEMLFIFFLFLFEFQWCLLDLLRSRLKERFSVAASFCVLTLFQFHFIAL